MHVSGHRTTHPPVFGLPEAARERLRGRIEAAVDRARNESARAALAAVTVPVDPGLDLSAAVLAARRTDDRWFCFEQPDRDGFVLAGLGQAALLQARGPGRFSEVAASARALGRGALADGLDGGPAASGPVFVGGFAFAEDGGASPEWSSLAPASLVLPEVSLARHRGEARMTVSVAVDGDEAAGGAARAGRPPPRRARPGRHAADRPGPRRPGQGRERRPALALRARRRARRRAHPRRAAREGRPRPRGPRPRRRATTTPAPCWAPSGRSSRPASAGASAPRSSPSSAPAPSCSCAATAPAPRASPSPAPPAAAPIRPSTTTSANSWRAAPRSARSRRSSPAASSGRSSR